ncbi:MAG: ABC transporter substrate-binding protein [Rhizobiaceae bacterium]|nr:ABC transporter substrate-binding protein [Rhizobiaceae bacterium]
MSLDLRRAIALACLVGASMTTAADADEIVVASGAIGTDLVELAAQFDAFTEQSGHTVKLVSMPASTSEQFGQYRLWLAARNPDVDIYRTDVIWAPQLARHFVDLKEPLADVIPNHFPAIIESQMVEGRLVAAPMYTDAPALYYRKDLLEKHGKKPPETWDELTAIAVEIQEKERAEGQSQLWGFLFQGAAYEGLTCDALEWIVSSGGGKIVEEDGSISVNNPQAAAALTRAQSWIGSISPGGTLAYKEEDTRGVWQAGNAVFMRNWPYAYALGNGTDSPIRGKFDVTTLPVGAEGQSSAATLGGWNLAVSEYSEHRQAAIELVRYMTGEEAQKYRAIQNSRLPTLMSLYEDAEIAEKQPLIPRWQEVFLNAVPRPSAATKGSYNEMSSEFWTAVNNTLAGRGTAEENLKRLEARLTRLKRDGWK